MSKRPLPAKDQFAGMEMTYLDSGSQHPISLGAKASAERYLSSRTFAGGNRGFRAAPIEDRVRARFAQLINASVEEICFVPSTTAGEHLVIKSLGLDLSPGRIVTDTLHFPGSFYLYDQLQKRGHDVVWVKDRDGIIPPDAMERAITKGTRLVALSWVSGISGFEHDLEKIAQIAHARGAFVYVDIIQGAGCVPLDIAASGVDFAACSGYKWLMGDFGLGFLYVRRNLLQQIGRTQYGYYQLNSYRTSAFPIDPPGSNSADYVPRTDAVGHFAMGTLPHLNLVQLEWSLDYLLELGVQAIGNYRRPMIDRLKAELPPLGFPLLTPLDARTPFVACTLDDAYRLQEPLEAHGVQIGLSRNRFRVSVSIFNDMDDVQRLIDVLALVA
jgi:selenocysteine lyase/cysteine desulfurase